MCNPKAVANCNSNMNGDDLFDDFMVHFSTTRNTLKNY